MQKRAGRRVQKAAGEERSARVVDLYIMDRLTMTAIAKAVGISIGRVSQIIAEAKKGWQERRAEALDKQQDEAIAMLDHLQGLAKRGYELSRLPAVETSAEREKRLEELEKTEEKIGRAQAKINGKRTGRPPSGTLFVPPELRLVGEKDKESVKHRAEGNAKFLDLLKWCVEVRLKMSGLLVQSDLNVDARSGVFVDLFERMTTPPALSAEEQPDPVEERLRLLEQSEVVEVKNVGETKAGGG